MAGTVEFADYSVRWQPPTGPGGEPIVGWCNELGVTAPPGVGFFCDTHLERAQALRHMRARQAVELMRTDADRPEGAV
ncbi:MAG: hypothetical protein ACRDU5_05415 [Mycobacterium sp.]